jgi:uncharacterized protein YbjQ (UPF0145 family)
MNKEKELCRFCGKPIPFLSGKKMTDGAIVHMTCSGNYERGTEVGKWDTDDRNRGVTDDVPNLLTSTTYEIDGYQTIRNLGLVRGSTVRARNIGSDIGASIKSVLGGELRGVTQLMADAREQAFARMLRDAESLGANAVVGIKFSTAQVWEGAAEVLAYGTAAEVQSISNQSKGNI